MEEVGCSTALTTICWWAGPREEMRCLPPLTHLCMSCSDLGESGSGSGWESYMQPTCGKRIFYYEPKRLGFREVERAVFFAGRAKALVHLNPPRVILQPVCGHLLHNMVTGWVYRGIELSVYCSRGTSPNLSYRRISISYAYSIEPKTYSWACRGQWRQSLSCKSPRGKGPRGSWVFACILKCGPMNRVQDWESGNLAFISSSAIGLSCDLALILTKLVSKSF